ncbi:MAG: hypothetical protein K5753_04620 [Clostridia bacterium]|nr:hypothetical protein [Clostridia bacterium]
MNNNELRQIIQNAIHVFNRRHKYLIENDVSERCICSSFARCIEDELPTTEEFRNISVDVEYNRGSNGNEGDPKILNGKNIVVDLIVHKRGFDNHYGMFNLICIEMKKSTDRRGYNDDINRLKCLVSKDYGFVYRCGFMIVIDMQNQELIIQSEFFLFDNE